MIAERLRLLKMYVASAVTGWYRVRNGSVALF